MSCIFKTHVPMKKFQPTCHIITSSVINLGQKPFDISLVLSNQWQTARFSCNFPFQDAAASSFVEVLRRLPLQHTSSGAPQATTGPTDKAPPAVHNGVPQSQVPTATQDCKTAELAERELDLVLPGGRRQADVRAQTLLYITSRARGQA